MAKKAIPIETRFWRYVEKTDHCWVWTGAKTYGGYGVINGGRRQKLVRAHRLSYTLAYGPFDPVLDVCHACDNPKCVRPEHLFLGDAKANVADMLAKGRASGGGPSGEEHHQAKLNWASVAQIRDAYATGESSLNKLAKQFDVSKKTIFNIVHRKIWLS